MALQQWSEIADDGWTAIVLGNGASISVHPGFAYSSLLETARTHGLISEPLKKVFDHFKTTDFEFILRALANASAVNDALGIKDSATGGAYGDVKKALIEAVRKVHVSYDDASRSLDAAAGYLARFDTVVSLNYDLLVYWAMLKRNTDLGASLFKDCFVKASTFEYDWSYLRQPRAPATSATLVFYPHGHLALGTTVFGDERKIASSEKVTLLDAVFDQWESGAVSPLFVSEGTSEQKQSTINRSSYLKTVYEEILPELGTRIACYGWSMSEQDNHLLKAILSRRGLECLAVSVRATEDTAEQIRRLEGRIWPFVVNCAHRPMTDTIPE